MQAKHHHELHHTPESLQSFVYYYHSKRTAHGHEAIVKMGYSFYFACSAYSDKSPVVRLFWKVLSGQLSEGVHVDQQVMFTGLQQLVGAMAASPGKLFTSVVLNCTDCLLVCNSMLALVLHIPQVQASCSPKTT